MKRIKVPLINQEILLYLGEPEWKSWIKSCKKYGCKDPILDGEMPSDPQEGIAVGDIIWVNSKCITTVFHEIQHALDFVFATRRIGEEEGEFKAYIAGFVNGKVFEWLKE